MEFTDKMDFGGSFIDKKLTTIHLNIAPCIPNPPELLCQAQRYNPDGSPNGAPISTINISSPAARVQTLALLSEFLRDFSVEFGYPEDSPALDEFGTPMVRSLVFHNDLKINSNYASAYKYYISQTEVETESGSFKTEITKKKGLKLESSNLSLNSRKVEDSGPAIYTTGGVTAFKTIPAFFFRISIELTNKTYTLRRVYQSFVGYLGNLGGNFEIILFTFAILVTIHSTVEMDVNMLNYIVLKDQQEMIEEPIKAN